MEDKTSLLPDFFEFRSKFSRCSKLSSFTVCILPPPIFKNVFDVYNFCIISNLFDSNKPYALSTHNKNERTKYIIFGDALRIRIKKFEHDLPESYSKGSKIAITARKFSNFSGAACPRTPLKLFLCHNLLQIGSVEKKYH